MRNMGWMAATTDPHWPSAASLLRDEPIVGRRNVALFGVSTYATSVSPRSSTSTPAAVREALERYSTWSFHGRFDLAENVVLVDHGDVEDPDGEGGHERVADALAKIEKFAALTVVLGGDNATTWHALSALAKDHFEDFGLITLDAHLDMREGRSNGSPVRQLLDEGLDPRHVVQVGLGDFSNSAAYARESSSATPFIAKTRGRSPVAPWRSPATAVARSTSTLILMPRIARWCRAVPLRHPED